MDRDRTCIRNLERRIGAVNTLHLLRDGWRPWCPISYGPSELICEHCKRPYLEVEFLPSEEGCYEGTFCGQVCLCEQGEALLDEASAWLAENTASRLEREIVQDVLDILQRAEPALVEKLVGWTSEEVNEYMEPIKRLQQELRNSSEYS